MRNKGTRRMNRELTKKIINIINNGNIREEKQINLYYDHWYNVIEQGARRPRISIAIDNLFNEYEIIFNGKKVADVVLPKNKADYQPIHRHVSEIVDACEKQNKKQQEFRRIKKQIHQAKQQQLAKSK